MAKILSFVDGSVYAKSVCGYSAWAASRLEADVDIYHVLGRREGATEQANLSGNIGLGARTALLEELAELDGQRAKLAQKRGRAILEDAEAIASEGHDQDVQVFLRNGDVVETAKKFEPDADLLIIGKRGEAADFAKLHLGSNIERVARATKKPLLIASRAVSEVKSFVFAFDGSANGKRIVDVLSTSKLMAGLGCHIVWAGRATDEAETTLAAAVKKLSGTGFVVSWEIIDGEPEDVIASAIEAQGHDMLVMGAYGHSHIRSLIIGSTTSAMIQSCKVPILLIR